MEAKDTVMTLTRKDAVAQSIRKWEAIVEGREPEEECGFCVLFGKIGIDTNEACLKNCPLHPEICSNYYDDDTLYWRWERARRYLSPELSQPLAEMMLEAIRRLGAAWIKKE